MKFSYLLSSTANERKLMLIFFCFAFISVYWRSFAVAGIFKINYTRFPSTFVIPCSIFYNWISQNRIYLDCAVPSP